MDEIRVYENMASDTFYITRVTSKGEVIPIEDGFTSKKKAWAKAKEEAAVGGSKAIVIDMVTLETDKTPEDAIPTVTNDPDLDTPDDEDEDDEDEDDDDE